MVKRKSTSNIDMNALIAYMTKKGIPRQMIELVRVEMAKDAVRESKDLKYDRIYSVIGLMLHNVYGFEADEILKGLVEIDRLFGYICDDSNDDEWPWLIKTLRDETGLVIQVDENNRIISEYIGDEEDEEINTV